MTRRITIGIILGIIAGIIDIIPMVIQNLTWDANLSAFFLWIVVGIFLAISNLKLPGILRGIIIAFLCLLPSTFIIGWKEPISLLPIAVMTLILGSLIGIAFSRIFKD